MTKAITCPVCGENRLRVREGATDIEIDGGVRVKVRSQSHECEACGSNMALSEDMRANARYVREATKAHRRMLTGTEVRSLRKRLGLSQDEAARLFGGGPVAFSKYENDEIVQSESMDRLLWIVGEFPWLVGCIAEHFNVTIHERASITIERRRMTVSAEDFSRLDIQAETSSQSLRGFRELTSASNDKIYKPSVDASPVDRIAA